MLAFVVVEAEPGANPSLGLGNALISIEVDFLVFEAAPQPLDEDVVHAAALAVHADHHPVPLQCPGEIVTGELAALVGIENPGRAVSGERLLSASTQKSAPSVFDSRHASTTRLTQSMTTTK